MPVDSLTPAQRQAAEYSGGPLVVLAGPGTGKTRTMVHRIVHQIRGRGVEPERIVALTFTVKAANQLRSRLADVIGATQAERINAHTIHAFGHRLVRRFGDLLGIPAELELIDAAQESRLIKRIVLDHGLFAESRGEGLSGIVAELRQAFECLGNMGLLPERCGRFAEEWGGPLGRPSRLCEGGELSAESVRQKRFADTGAAYALYTRERLKRGLVGFEDFVTLPIRLFSESARALAVCRDDYRAFIVDEFQDCNPGQIELLRLLAPPGSGIRGPDLCVVGDDDQAIYRFRGADEQAFARFAKVWRGHKVFELSENYRGAPELIRVSNAVIARAQVRYKADKVIKSPEGKTARKAVIEAVKLESDTHDADVIAAMILAARAQGHAGSIAVIARGHGDLDRVSTALRVEGIPFERVREKDQFDDAGVEDVLAWIEWLIDPDATWAARRVLTRPPYGLPPDVVTQWELEFIAKESKAAAGRTPRGWAPKRFAEFIPFRALGEWGAAMSAGAKYEELAKAVATLRADEAVYRIILGTDPAHAEMQPGRERARRITALVSFLTLAREKQARLEAPGDLRELWSYLKELRGKKGELPTPQTLAEALDSDEPTAAEGEQTDGRVQLLTAHSAKGLEFDTVFVPRVSPGPGFPKSASDDSWRAPEGLLEQLDTRRDTERRADEERRLFYVACTRAERRLVLLAKWNKNPSGTTHFFEELVRGNREQLPITLRDGADILKEAADLGVGVAARSDIELAGHGYDRRDQLKEATDRVRRQSRLEAALALEAIERGDLASDHLEVVNERLRAAAAQIAAAAQAETDGSVAPWLVKAHPDLAPLAHKLEAVARAGALEKDRTAESFLFAPIGPPLELSYTAVHDYLNCPRCYYLKSVMRLPEEERTKANVGTIAHRALKDFFDQWGAAEAEGREKPGLERLLAMAKERYVGSLREQEKVNEEVLDQLAAQMKLLYERLHGGDASSPHILETERTHVFDYELDGRTHRFTGKIDRIDLLPDGGVRIIDYKTGRVKRAYTEPDKGDLQLGVYALTLKLAKGQSWAQNGSLRGVAEYWCLATGERGSISLAELDENKVRAKIDEAARGMLEGRFASIAKCRGPCRVFGDGD
jgi:DNA helicase-2/ATP-dependent DNA helicase PcrA